jgi:hypothetical protein
MPPFERVLNSVSPAVALSDRTQLREELAQASGKQALNQGDALVGKRHCQRDFNNDARMPESSSKAAFC